MFTTCDPQDDEKVTSPLCLFTVISNVKELVPVTLCEAGDT